jgi:hypothetical protein
VDCKSIKCCLGIESNLLTIYYSIQKRRKEL